MYAWFIRTGFEKLEIANCESAGACPRGDRHPDSRAQAAPAPIGRAVPISRLNLDEYNLLTVHS
ncbi:hypothetical protein [Bordetella pertussis]|uniref:hypothetical protein n=1 Tax=Bordetella pertussis TaxID=520 RepID=UPI0003D3EBD5|nr:hypothetical protein [Bordetella pertussis]ETI08560.1 hypothetical protein L557_3357 [Bordetella pertussis STO1-CNMC-0004]